MTKYNNEENHMIMRNQVDTYDSFKLKINLV